MAVVLDRHARRRPYPPGTAAQGGRPRHNGRPERDRRKAVPPGHIRALRLKSPTVSSKGGQEPPILVGSLAVGITSPPRPDGTICVPYACRRLQELRLGYTRFACRAN